MTVLILLTCLIADPSQCEEQTLPLSDATMNQCMIGAQNIVEKWQDDHNTWRVREFHCNRDSGRGDE